MIFSLRVFLWTIVAELEYYLYPWKDQNPPEDVSHRYNLPSIDFDNSFNYDWLKSHDEKISRLQDEIICIQQEIHKLNVKTKTHD